MNRNEQKILALIERDPYLSQQEMADALGISRPSLANLISGLFKQGRITSAQAAKITGLTWRQFLAEASAQGIPAVSWDDEEIAAERSVVAEGR